MSGRVLHVLRKLDPAAWGGTETHVEAIAQRLPARGWNGAIGAPRLARAHTDVPVGGFPVRRFHAFCPFVGSRAEREALVANGGNIASFELMRMLGRDRTFSLAHVHTGGRVAAAVRTAMRWTGRPYVVSFHGPVLSAPAFLAEQTARLLDPVVDLGKPIGWALGARHVIDDAARVICFNDEEHAALAAKIGERAVRMDHGVDLERCRSGDDARARAAWPELGDAPVVLVVGRLADQKNQLLAVAAFAKGAPSDHRLVLAGAETDQGYRARVEAEASRLGVRARVHVLGNVPRTAVPDLYARARLVLVPSKQEAFGLVVLEAYAAGRPVLFARRHGLEDVARALRHDPATVLDLEVETWASAMRAMLASGTALAANAAAGGALVAERFTWDRAADALARLYDEVLAERQRVRARAVR